MTIQAHPKQHTAKTTTLVVERPPNYTLLEARFQLVRYLIPDALRHRGNPTDFGRVHNTVRDQLDYPYRSFQHDKLDGAKNEKWAIYVLYPRGAQIGELALPWFGGQPLPRREIAFSGLPLHVLLKLLAFRFFRGDKTHRFVGQDKCYVYARPGGKDTDFHYCVEIELSGAPGNTEGAPTQEFRVTPHARCFGKAAPPFRPGWAYFGKRSVGSRFLFLHLKSEAVEQEPTVYSLVTFPGKRAQVKYHDPRDVNAGKGKIVFDFTQQFIAHLKELGIVAHLRERTFTLAPLLDAAAEDFKEDGLLFGRTDPYPALYNVGNDLGEDWSPSFMATQLRALIDEVQSEEHSCIEESDLAELRERIRVELLAHLALIGLGPSPDGREQIYTKDL